MIITKTNFPMPFLGAGTDMEGYSKENGGVVFTTTFDKRSYMNVRHLPHFFDYSTKFSYSQMERVTSVDNIQYPTIRKEMKMLDMREIRLTYDADFPARFSFGTSSYHLPLQLTYSMLSMH